MRTDVNAGTIFTIAGDGTPAYGGDGGPATRAQLNEPKGVTVDRDGGLYIADAENHLVRKVDPITGAITTVAGRPTEDERTSQPVEQPGAADDDPFGGPSHVTERFREARDVTGTVRFMAGQATNSARFAGDGGPATAALLNFPAAVALDRAGNLYIADTLNHRVRKVDAMTRLITTIAGTGQHRFAGDGGAASAAALNEPAALACDTQYLYIADQGNHRVRAVDLSTGTIRTVAGVGEPGYSGDGMPAHESALFGPSGLALGPDGALYIADTFNGRIRMIERDSGVIRTVAGDGQSYQYQGDADRSMSVSRPYGIAVDVAGDVFLTDSDNHLIRRWSRARGMLIRVTGTGAAAYTGDGGPALQASVNYPFGVAVDPSGTVYIADTFNHRIRGIAAS